MSGVNLDKDIARFKEAAEWCRQDGLDLDDTRHVQIRSGSRDFLEIYSGVARHHRWVAETAERLAALGWDRFRERYLTNYDDLVHLSGIGLSNRFQLGAHIGLPYLRPGGVVEAFACEAGFGDEALGMCQAISAHTGEPAVYVAAVLYFHGEFAGEDWSDLDAMVDGLA